MEDSKNKISHSLQSAYDEMYSDESTAWRELCAKYKAENIEAVCKGKHFSSVLECGAGEGAILKFLDGMDFCDDLSAIEISDSGIQQIEKRRLKSIKSIKKFDGYAIPFEDRSFDLAYCSHVIEHVEHPRILLRELKRVSQFQVFEIPLDYSSNVDVTYKSLLSYGHINVFTPAIFKFLLKSEGFEIISERYTRSSPEVIKYNWYKNMGLKNNWILLTKLKLAPFSRLYRRIRYGQLYNEIGFTAYTCLTKNNGDLQIF